MKHTIPAPSRPALPRKQWFELYDHLIGALNALGEQPEAFSEALLREAVACQRKAIQMSHDALRRIGGEA